MIRKRCVWPGCRLKPEDGLQRCEDHGYGLPDILHLILENLAVATRLGFPCPESLADQLAGVLRCRDLDEMAGAALPLVESSGVIKRTAERLHMEALLAGRVGSPTVIERDLLATLRFASRVEKRAAKNRRQA